MGGPHDRFAKGILSRPKNAASELARVLPKELSAQVDWSSLELSSTTYVESDLQDRYSDLVYTARLGTRNSVLYILIEHQSRAEPLMMFRLLRYLVNIWSSEVANDAQRTTLPPVLPVLVLHTPPGSPLKLVPLTFCELLDVEPELLPALSPYQPDFRALVDNLNDLDAETILAMRVEPSVKILLRLLGQVRWVDDLLSTLEGFDAVLQQLAEERLELGLVASYLLEVTEREPNAIKDFFVQRLGPVGEEEVMTAAQQLTEQVRIQSKAEGRAEGRAEAILQVLHARGIAVTPTQRDKVLGTRDLAQLDHWLRRAAVASSADALFE